MDEVIQKNPSTPGALSSPEQIRNWILDLTVAVREARAHCDLEPNAVVVRSWERKLLVRYGAAKGALDACYRLGQVDDTFYSTVSDQILVAIATRVTEAVDASFQKG